MDRKTPSTSEPPMPPPKLGRRTAEKNRRNRMTFLLHHLFSLVPPQHLQPNTPTKELALPERLEQATGYLEQLRDRVERLRERRASCGSGGDAHHSRLPVLKVMDLQGSGLQVILVTRKGLPLPVSEVVRVLEEEGTEVVGVNIATIGDRVYHTFNAQVKIQRIGVDAARIAGRIHDLSI